MSFSALIIVSKVTPFLARQSGRVAHLCRLLEARWQDGNAVKTSQPGLQAYGVHT